MVSPPVMPMKGRGKMRYRWIVVGVLTLSVIAILIGCSEEFRVKQLEQQNKAVVRHVHEEIARGKIGVFDEVLTPNYIRHCQAMPPDLQELHGTEQFKALSAVCTLLGCTVQYRKDFQHIWCACHNGHFDLNGRNIAGPPPTPLEEYQVVARADSVFVSNV